MEKRFQVFVSSTYADLKDERQRVIQALMEMDCIPAGMEIFPAADDEQWEFIKKVIDDCDYYLLIIGGRYGSLSAEGVSYTEKEYDYAVSLGLKVLVFLHQDPEQISLGKSDTDPTLRAKLDNFRTKVSANRLVKFWRNADELPGLVALSLSKTIKAYPAIGWARANNISNNELLNDLNSLRKENAQLREQIQTHGSAEPLETLNLASLEEHFDLTVKWTEYNPRGADYKMQESIKRSWGQIFSLIAPNLQEHPSDGSVRYNLGTLLLKEIHPGKDRTATVEQTEFETVRIQLLALDLISVRYSNTVQGGTALFWSLTDRGLQKMIEMRTLKSAK